MPSANFAGVQPPWEDIDNPLSWIREPWWSYHGCESGYLKSVPYEPCDTHYLNVKHVFVIFSMPISVLKHNLQSLTIEAQKDSAMEWFPWVWHGSDSVMFTLLYPHYIHDTWQVKVLLSPLRSHKRLSCLVVTLGINCLPSLCMREMSAYGQQLCS